MQHANQTDRVFDVRAVAVGCLVELPTVAALIKAGHFGAALDLIGQVTPDTFLTVVAHLAAAFEEVRPGLSGAVLWEAVAVAGWVQPEWRGIDELLAATECGQH